MSQFDRPEIIAKGKHLHLEKRGTWEYVTRPNISGIVAVVAVTDRKLILVEQFRPPVNRQVIEIPAGLAGDSPAAASEDLAAAAMRELEEESGYRASSMRMLASGVSSAGLTDEIITLFRAEGLTKVSDGGGDEHEDIRVHEIPVDNLHRWLEQQVEDGLLVDLKVYSALYFAMQPEHG